MKAPLNIFKLLKIEPTNDLEIIKKAQYTRAYELHLQELDNPQFKSLNQILEIKLVDVLVSSQKKLDLYHQKYTLNSFLQNKTNTPGFFNLAHKKNTGFISLRVNSQQNDVPAPDVLCLPELKGQEKPQINLHYIVQLINKITAETTIPVGLDLNEMSRILNSHTLNQPILLIRVKISKNCISNDRFSEIQILDSLEQPALDASSQASFWTLIGSEFSVEDILEIYPLPLNYYKNGWMVKENINSLWPLNYHYKPSELPIPAAP